MYMDEIVKSLVPKTSKFLDVKNQCRLDDEIENCP